MCCRTSATYKIYLYDTTYLLNTGSFYRGNKEQQHVLKIMKSFYKNRTRKKYLIFEIIFFAALKLAFINNCGWH